MERGSNKVGGLIRVSVRDLGGKCFTLMILEGRGLVGGWKIFFDKL